MKAKPNYPLRALLFCLCLYMVGCAGFRGDRMMTLTSDLQYPESRQVLETARQDLLDLYRRLKLPPERQVDIESIEKYELVQHDSDFETAHLTNAVLLINGGLKISHCRNCIIVASGDVELSHSNRNVIVTRGNVNIAHDRGGSIIVAEEDVQLSNAADTTIDAGGETTTSHQRNVLIYTK